MVEENPELDSNEELEPEAYEAEDELEEEDSEEEEGRDLKCPCCGSALMSVDYFGCVLEDYGPCDCCIADLDLDFQQIYLPELEEAEKARWECATCDWQGPDPELPEGPLDRLIEKIEGDPLMEACHNLGELVEECGVSDIIAILPHIAGRRQTWDGGAPGMSGVMQLCFVMPGKMEEVQGILVRFTQLAREVVAEARAQSEARSEAK